MALKNFLTLPHTLLSTCNSLLSFIELPTRVMNSHAIPTTLSSQFHSSPPESGFLPSTPWQPLCDDPWPPMWPNTPIISLLIQHPSNAQVTIPSWNPFFAWLPGCQKPLISHLTGSYLSIFLWWILRLFQTSKHWKSSFTLRFLFFACTS